MKASTRVLDFKNGLHKKKTKHYLKTIAIFKGYLFILVGVRTVRRKLSSRS